MVVGGGRRRPAVEPIEEIGVGAFEKGFVAIELRSIEVREIGFGKATEDEVGLSRTAMPGTVVEPSAARILGGLVLCSHECAKDIDARRPEPKFRRAPCYSQ